MRGAALLSELVDGDGPLTPEAVAALRAAFREWLATGAASPLARLHLPPTPAKARLALRDLHLARAAEHAEGSSWHRTMAVHRAARRLRGGRWRRGCAPVDLDPMTRELWRALDACDALPSRPEAVLRAIARTSQSPENGK